MNTLDEYARLNGIKTTYVFDRGEGTPRGGATIGWRYLTNYKNSKVIEVAVAYCHSKEVFCKKTGRQTMLKSFEQANTLIIPLTSVRENVPFLLQDMFSIPFNI